MCTQQIERPWSHFKIEIFDGWNTAYMTLSDIAPIECASEDNVVNFMKLDRLKLTMRDQLFQDHIGKELSFHSAKVHMVRNDVTLRYVIKEIYYANDETLKLFLGSVYAEAGSGTRVKGTRVVEGWDGCRKMYMKNRASGRLHKSTLAREDW